MTLGVGLQCVIVVFPDHTHLRLRQISDLTVSTSYVSF